MKKAVVLSVVVVLALVVTLAFVGAADQWPAVESPPRQGEALDERALERGEFSHSPLAVGRLIREPQNTWSNLAFIFAGACLACLTSLRASRFVGAALVAVGVGSFLYHASASRSLRHLDVGAMYGLFFAMTALASGSLHSRLRQVTESRVLLLAAAALAFAAFATAARNFVILGVKPLALSTVTAAASSLFSGSLILLAWRKRSLRLAVGVGSAVALFLGAVVCQIGDRPGGWLLDPASGVQAHALWHVLAALALSLAVQMFEVGAKKPNKAPEPTTTPVTSPADAGAAPAAVVAHL